MSDPWWIRAAAWVITGFSLVYVAAHVAVIRRLKKKHTFEWSEIGEPPPLRSMSLLSFQPARDFLASGAYRDLADERLDRLVQLKRQAFRLALVSYIAIIVIRFILRHV